MHKAHEQHSDEGHMHGSGYGHDTASHAEKAARPGPAPAGANPGGGHMGSIPAGKHPHHGMRTHHGGTVPGHHDDCSHRRHGHK